MAPSAVTMTVAAIIIRGFIFVRSGREAYPSSRLPSHADRRIGCEAVSAVAHLESNTNIDDRSDIFIVQPKDGAALGPVISPPS